MKFLDNIEKYSATIKLGCILLHREISSTQKFLKKKNFTNSFIFSINKIGPEAKGEKNFRKFLLYLHYLFPIEHSRI